MKRPILELSRIRTRRVRRHLRHGTRRVPDTIAGYTLIEILVATTLALLLAGGGGARFSATWARASPIRGRCSSRPSSLRLAAARLQQDLAGVTVTMNPPRKPENNEGYFEYIEGPVGARR